MCYYLNCKQGWHLPYAWKNVVVALGNINLCINPVIYASRYEVFRKSLRKMLKKDNTVATMAT